MTSYFIWLNILCDIMVLLQNHRSLHNNSLIRLCQKANKKVMCGKITCPLAQDFSALGCTQLTTLISLNVCARLVFQTITRIDTQRCLTDILTSSSVVLWILRVKWLRARQQSLCKIKCPGKDGQLRSIPGQLSELIGK